MGASAPTRFNGSERFIKYCPVCSLLSSFSLFPLKGICMLGSLVRCISVGLCLSYAIIVIRCGAAEVVSVTGTVEVTVGTNVTLPLSKTTAGTDIGKFVLSNISKTFDLNDFKPGFSAKASANGVSYWNSTSGQLQMNMSASASAPATTPPPPLPYGITAYGWSRVSVAVELETPSWVRMSKSSAGSVLVNGIYIGDQIFFAQSSFTISLSASAAAFVSEDGGPYSAGDSERAVLHWAIADTPDSDGFVFPGSSPSNPIRTLFKSDEPPPPQRTGPAGIRGDVTLPVKDTYGLNSDIYLGVPSGVSEGESSGALTTGFSLTSESSAIRSLSIPADAEVASSATITYDNQTFALAAGNTFDFGLAGLSSFTIEGLHPTAVVEDLLVMGLRFASEGDAFVSLDGILYIPPGDHNENGLVDTADYVAWRKGFATGAYTEADHETWRSNFGAPSVEIEPSTETTLQSTIPEPSTLALVVVAVCAMSGYRRGRRLLRRTMEKGVM